ncbi:hypothetical protein CSKR_110460 [Clonorchis sinensis]|uniref:Uncharacterized protein n=1 Tax=Clonorchis sinensis TaxID=79923 RepID=A0A419Q7Z0_CLOSI|nr:hypothetical protein CSKR_110460 [Clonorchis sinensis]
MSINKLFNCNTALRCLTAMPPEGCTRAGILPGCPSLDRGSGDAEFGFEPRTFRSGDSRSNLLSYLSPNGYQSKGSNIVGENEASRRWNSLEDEDKKGGISEIHSFANKFGFARDSPGTQLNLPFVVFPGN